MLVVQAFSQLREIYGPQNAETMMKSLAARIVYAPKDIVEATEISNELGFTTVKARTHSKPVADFTNAKTSRQRSVSVSEQRRSLLLPQEVKELGKNREVIFYEGIRPVLARKNRYYQDPNFKKRLFPPPAAALPTAARGARGANPVPKAPPVTAVDLLAEESIAPTPKPEVREATLKDIDHIHELTLEDFAADFSAVKLPAGPLSEGDLGRAVDSFLDSLRER
jgi:type IV secretion system protein VirD4